MKFRFLYAILFCCLLLTLPRVAYSQSEEAITESKALALIDAADRAARRKDVAGMMAPFASNATIKQTLPDPKTGQERVLTLNKEQFTNLLRQAVRVRFAYRLERKNSQVKIYDRETAMVTSELYETFTVRRVTFRVASSEVYFLSLRDGKIVITGAESRARIY